MAAIKSALVLIIGVVFNLYIYVLLVRLLLQKVGASWHNPVSQFVLKITDPVVKPIQKFIPGFKGFDLAIVVLALVLELIETWLVVALKVSMLPGFLGLLVMSLAQLGTKVVNIYLWAIIIGAVVSWFPAMRQNPVTSAIDSLTAPLLGLARKYIPQVGGFDLSPIPIILACFLINMLVFNPLFNAGVRLAF